MYGLTTVSSTHFLRVLHGLPSASRSMVAKVDELSAPLHRIDSGTGSMTSIILFLLKMLIQIVRMVTM